MIASKARTLAAFVGGACCAGALVLLGALNGCAQTPTDESGQGGSTASGLGGSTGVAGMGGPAGASGGSGPSSGNGGSTGVAGSTGPGGSAAGSTGVAGSVAGAGGTSVAGQGGTSAGGRGGTGGGATGGSTGGSPGGSTGGAAGGSTGKPPANPSAGCGKANPATGSSGSPLNVSNHQYYVKLPTGYDASKPYPVIFMFNPTGNPLSWAETSAGFESNGAKAGAIRVYPGPASMANGWGAGDVSFFMPLYNQVIANYCVDKARMFAAGESSGGDFSSILGCEYANVLRAVGPCATKDVSGYPLNASTRKCTGQVTSVVIHGKNDNVVGPANGPKTRDFYVALNHCMTANPQPVAGYTDTLSNCVQYQGCDPGYPVYWCNHTDPEYSGTNHGWPKFAAGFLWSLFSSY
jgi:poly(3-hydroxybutyrate) depolymerase